MSATFDTKKFSDYFRNNSNLEFEMNSPAVCITQENRHQLHVFYIDSLKSLGDVSFFFFLPYFSIYFIQTSLDSQILY